MLLLENFLEIQESKINLIIKLKKIIDDQKNQQLLSRTFIGKGIQQGRQQIQSDIRCNKPICVRNTVEIQQKSLNIEWISPQQSQEINDYDEEIGLKNKGKEAFDFPSDGIITRNDNENVYGGNTKSFPKKIQDIGHIDIRPGHGRFGSEKGMQVHNHQHRDNTQQLDV